MSRRAVVCAAIVLTGLFGACIPILAQAGEPAKVPFPSTSPDLTMAGVEYFRQALWSLPLAAALGAALALRPRRRGQPPRSSAVIQTQILLAVIGALVLLVVGASLARAFGVVGVAGLVRYRAKIKDPKDAGVMLATLAVGLAAGVGLWQLALFATAFVIVGLWVLEMFEPELRRTFLLTVKSKKAAKLEPVITKVLRQHRAKVELRSSAPDEVSFELRLPLGQKTDDLSKSITELDPDSTLAWEDKKANAPA
jgi:hypothetical protein